MVDFDKFDSMIDNAQIKKDIESASSQQYEDVPKGTYMVSIAKMEIKPTKAGDKLLFSVQCKITETVNAKKKQDGRWIFMNRVIAGNRVTDKWNDGKAIAVVLGWLKQVTDEEIDFKSYSQLSEEVESIYNDVCPSIEMEVEYDPEGFNTISINEVYDI